MYVVSPQADYRYLEREVSRGVLFSVHLKAVTVAQNEPINGSLVVDLHNGERAAVQIANGYVTRVEHQVFVNPQIVLGRSMLKGED